MPDPIPTGMDPDQFAWLIQHRGEMTPGGETSSAGAKGVMQVLDSTARDPGFGVRPAYDDTIAERARLGIDYAKALLQHYRDPTIASAAYNAGPGRVDEWLQLLGDPRKGEMTSAQWAATIPFDETRRYTARVMGYQGAMPLKPGSGPATSNPVETRPMDGPKPWDLEAHAPDHPDWQTAALSGNLLSHMLRNTPGMNELVPGWNPNAPWWQRAMDYGSVPARVAVNALTEPFVAGGRAFDAAMAGDPNAPRLTTDAMVGMGMLGLGVPKVPGSLGVFGGRRGALTLANAGDRRAFDLEMQARFAAPNRTLELGEPANRAAWDRTGWFQDVDGNWKFELSDQPARIKPGRVADGVVRTPTNESVLGDYLHHPELFAAYPELAATPIRPLAPGTAADVLGSVAADGTIHVRPGPSDKFMDTLLHEVQHKIQSREGFAYGGNSDEFLSPGFRASQADVRGQLDRYHAVMRGIGVNPQVAQLYLHELNAGNPISPNVARTIDKLDALGPDFLPGYEAVLDSHRAHSTESARAFRRYQGLAGEVEARNVTERRVQGAGRETPPWATGGYPIEEQEVRFANGTRARVVPVEHDPFRAIPVEHDPFAGVPTP